MIILKYVIIGNSAGAIGAVEGIRQYDKENQITIISDEAYHTYSRPLISYLLLGKTTEEKMQYRKQSFYEENNCNLLLSKKVTEIIPSKKTIKLDDGLEIAYDKLLISTGSIPFVPPMQGLDAVQNKFTFMTLNDAKSLQKVINKKSKVLVIGAGLIGLKCAEGIQGIQKGVANITVVDLSQNILSSILDNKASEMVKKHIEDKGIIFKLGDSVKSFTENTATLGSGEVINFDILVMAVGVRPNIELLANAGGKTNKGILVNEKMETSIKDIYSAGDCTESLDISSGQEKVLALLPNAYMQGECAGINMAGECHSFNKAIPMNAISFFGLHMITAGSYNGDVYECSDEKQYKKLFYKDNVLNGYIMVGNVEKAGIYTSLIRDKKPLDELDFDLVCKSPSLMAFSRADRKMKLGEANS